MKKKIVSVMLAALTLSAAITVNAAPSIGQIIPEAPVVVEGDLGTGSELIVQDADTDAYQNRTVADVVEKANDDNTVVTVKEILAALDVDTKMEIRTEDGKKVNPTLYEQLTPFVDLAVKTEDQITYESTGKIKVEMTFENAKEMDKKELVLMQIDPATGKVSFSAVEKLDETTGKIEATLAGLGPVALLKKVPIVVRDVDPEKYENSIVSETITSFKEEQKDLSLVDVLQKMADQMEEGALISTTNEEGIDIKNPVWKLDETTTIDLNNYVSAMAFADLAIKQGEENYLYDMDGELTADANRDIRDIDWQSIVAAGVEGFDLEAAEADPDLLTEIAPFVIDESIAVQLNPVSGEVDVIYEPELFFAYPEEEEEESIMDMTEAETEVETEAETEETATVEDDDTDLMGWEVHDEDKEDNTLPNLVIRGEYKSMGPFALFLRK